MLEIKNLTGGYVHVPVLKDVSFSVESGQLGRFDRFEWVQENLRLSMKLSVF